MTHHLPLRAGRAGSAGAWRSTNSRSAFSIMYDRVRSSASAIACNASMTRSRTRAVTGLRFSDAWRGVCGMTASVVVVSIVAICR